MREWSHAIDPVKDVAGAAQSRVWQGFHVKVWQHVPGADDTSIVGPSVVTVGVFDGVHRGHQALIAKVSAEAKARDAKAVVVTFDPHPMAVLVPEHAPLMLTDIEHRVELLHQAGADEVRVLNFSFEMAAWSPQEFVAKVISEQCGAAHVSVGENFRFGAKAAGTIETLREIGADSGFSVEAFALNGDTSPFSSSRIRAALACGDVSIANDLLGRAHEVFGNVIKGEQRGRELGFPTANVAVPPGIAVPDDGVYATTFTVGENVYWGATSVGTNPTFAGERHRTIETFVLDQPDLDIYDRHVGVAFQAHIRAMEKFDNVADLIAQMNRDVADVRKVLVGI